ncbi:MAG: transposase, partial [Desulfovibrio sp.]|nr:transposase [Desulfovibrio sp.]
MERLQAYKFQLRPKAAQEEKMRRFAGCCRFLWNKALALEKETYEATGKRLGFASLCKELRDWKRVENTAFLAETHSQILQQALKDLDRAYVNFFQKRADLPRFKKKGVHDSFRYPQGFKLDEGNSRIFLPKIGWMRYRKSRDTEGTPKQITVSLAAGKWYVSIQTEREVETPVHPSQSAVGIDMGIACFAALSDGTVLMPLHTFRKHEKKLAAMQRKLS